MNKTYLFPTVLGQEASPFRNPFQTKSTYYLYRSMYCITVLYCTVLYCTVLYCGLGHSLDDVCEEDVVDLAPQVVRICQIRRLRAPEESRGEGNVTRSTSITV